MLEIDYNKHMTLHFILFEDTTWILTIFHKLKDLPRKLHSRIIFKFISSFASWSYVANFATWFWTQWLIPHICLHPFLLIFNMVLSNQMQALIATELVTK